MSGGKWQARAAAMCVAALLIGGCARSEPAPTTKRIILVNNGADPFWDAMRAGMQDAERDLKLAEAGLRTVMDVNDGTEKGQVDKLRQYANQTDIAAVGVSVTNAENAAIAKAMSDLRAQGIHVIAVDSDVNRTKSRGARFAYLGTDNIQGGQELGRAALGVRPQGGTYATFVGLKGAANAIERSTGFKQGAGEVFSLAENLGDEMDLSTAKKNVKDALDRHPDIETLVGIWAYNAHAIVEVVKERGLREKTTIVGFDAAPKALQHMEEGNIDALVVQNPYDMGYRGTELLAALVRDDQATIGKMFPAWDSTKREFTSPDGDLIVTGLKVVYPDQGSPLKPEMFSPTTEFIKLTDFKAWLAKFKLTGS